MLTYLTVYINCRVFSAQKPTVYVHLKMMASVSFLYHKRPVVTHMGGCVPLVTSLDFRFHQHFCGTRLLQILHKYQIILLLMLFPFFSVCSCFCCSLFYHGGETFYNYMKAIAIIVNTLWPLLAHSQHSRISSIMNYWCSTFLLYDSYSRCTMCGAMRLFITSISLPN